MERAGNRARLRGVAVAAALVLLAGATGVPMPGERGDTVLTAVGALIASQPAEARDSKGGRGDRGGRGGRHSGGGKNHGKGSKDGQAGGSAGGTAGGEAGAGGSAGAPGTDSSGGGTAGSSGGSAGSAGDGSSSGQAGGDAGAGNSGGGNSKGGGKGRNGRGSRSGKGSDSAGGSAGESSGSEAADGASVGGSSTAGQSGNSQSNGKETASAAGAGDNSSQGGSGAATGSASSGATSGTETAAAAPAAEAPAAAAPAAQASNEAGAGQSRGGRDGGGRGEKSFEAGTILAIDPSERTLAVAQSLGFQVETQISYLSAGRSVARIVLPAGYDTLVARQRLRQALPEATFGLNHLFRGFYRPRRGSAAVTPRPGLCNGATCFNWELIGWDYRQQGCRSPARIGVLDTGLDRNHPALRDRLASGHIVTRTFVQPGQKPADGEHGTGVLALLAGDPASETVGLLPEAHYAVAQTFQDDKETGLPVADTLSLLAALSWMREQRVDIINMSFSGPPDDLLHEAIGRLRGEGVVLVAAAGNDGPDGPEAYPAAYPEVIAVTAVNAQRRQYIFANRGDYIDVAAPGVDVWTASPTQGGGAYESGTSFAAPHVTAILAAALGGRTTASKEAILAGLHPAELGEAGKDKVFGLGLLRSTGICREAPDPSVAAGAPQITPSFGANAAVGSLGFLPSFGLTEGGGAPSTPSTSRR